MPTEAIRGCCILWSGVTDDCKLPRGHWEPNPGPPEEQQVLSTAELSPAPVGFHELFVPEQMGMLGSLGASLGEQRSLLSTVSCPPEGELPLGLGSYITEGCRLLSKQTLS